MDWHLALKCRRQPFLCIRKSRYASLNLIAAKELPWSAQNGEGAKGGE